jgi:hypothetical protein
LSERRRIIPGQRFRVKDSLWNHRGNSLKQVKFSLRLPEGWEARQLEPDDDAAPSCHPVLGSQLYVQDYEIKVTESANLTCPYWLPRPDQAYSYDWPPGEPCSRPFGPPKVCLHGEVDLGQEKIRLNQGVVHRAAFPGGFRELSLAVIPPISLHPRTDREFFGCQKNEQHVKLQVIARNNGHEAMEGDLELVVPPGWQYTNDPLSGVLIF